MTLLHRISVLLASLFIATALSATAATRYPNEIKGVKLYSRYLAPLVPGQSLHEQVAKVLNSDTDEQLQDWRITPLYACHEDFTTCSHGPRNDPLDFLEITPKHRVSLLYQKFPAAFQHSLGNMSEVNVVCDVYKDEFGLEYWVVANDNRSFTKGDLLRIVHGIGLVSNPPKIEAVH
jgi:hypothetical protein